MPNWTDDNGYDHYLDELEISVGKSWAEYLKRKDIEFNASKGWNIICYNEISLGWVKILPNRVNNYYPVGWRILKE